MDCRFQQVLLGDVGDSHCLSHFSNYLYRTQFSSWNITVRNSSLSKSDKEIILYLRIAGYMEQTNSDPLRQPNRGANIP